MNNITITSTKMQQSNSAVAFFVDVMLFLPESVIQSGIPFLCLFHNRQCGNLPCNCATKNAWFIDGFADLISFHKDLESGRL